MSQKIKFTTKSGRAKYPWLNKADTEFDAEGKWKTQLILDPSDAEGLVTLMNETAHDNFGSKAKYKLPVTHDEQTGDVIIKAQSKYQPKYYDAAGQVIPFSKLPSLFGGSVLKLGGQLNPYTANGSKGISLLLDKVQVIEPVSSSGGADDGGFDAVDGFTVDSGDVVDTFDGDDASDF